MDLTTLFTRTFNQYPEKVAFIFRGEKVTFSQLHERSLLFAENLRHLGLKPADRVAIYLPNSLDFIYAYLGIIGGGYVAVPLNIFYRSREVKEILEDSEARVLISKREELGQINDLLPQMRGSVSILDVSDPKAGCIPHLFTKHENPPQSPFRKGGGRVSPFRKGGVGGISSVNPLTCTNRECTPNASAEALIIGTPPVSISQDDLAAICYTSGTTGPSKGAMLSHGNFASNIEALIATWEWTSRDIFVLAVPMFHMHGLGVALHGALTTGCTTVLMERFEAEAVLSGIAENKGTLFMGVPTMYARFLQCPEPERFDLTSMRLFISGSAPLSEEMFNQFKQIFGFEILERYGLTETIMNISNPYRGKRKPGAIGFPLPGVQIRILNKDGTEVAPGGIGEISVKGPNVFQGYWKHPEATAKILKDGWMHTGDLASQDEEGYFHIVGRAKDVIITGGFNVYPREVEEILCAHPAVKEAVVTGIPDKVKGELIKAYVVLVDPAGGSDQTEEELISYCKKYLAGFKVPRRMEFVDSLPRTASGKVITRLLLSTS